MFDQRVKRLPVTSDDGTLIGILSRSDVLSVYSSPDAQIRHQVTQDLILGTLLCDPDRFTVTVTGRPSQVGGPSGWSRQDEGPWVRGRGCRYREGWNHHSF